MPIHFKPVTARSTIPESVSNPVFGYGESNAAEPTTTETIVALNADPQIAKIETELRDLLGNFVFKSYYSSGKATIHPVASNIAEIELGICGYEGNDRQYPAKTLKFNFNQIAQIINNARKGREHSKAELERIAADFSKINQEFATKLLSFVPAETD